MDEQDLTPQKEEKPKSEWQKTKEGWYDKVPLTVKQLDMIIWGCTGALILIFLKIFIDAGIFG